MRQRPTQAKVRTAMFNVLGGQVAGARVADLFCGTGRLGKEALDRGAASVLFVDVDVRALKRAADATRHREGQVTLRRGDALRIIRTLGGANEFDLIFLDPPYSRGLVGRALTRIAESGIMAPGGLVVAEHSVCEPVTPGPALRVIREKKYGGTIVTFLEVDK